MRFCGGYAAALVVGALAVSCAPTARSQSAVSSNSSPAIAPVVADGARTELDGTSSLRDGSAAPLDGPAGLRHGAAVVLDGAVVLLDESGMLPDGAPARRSVSRPGGLAEEHDRGRLEDDAAVSAPTSADSGRADEDLDSALALAIDSSARPTLSAIPSRGDGVTESPDRLPTDTIDRDQADEERHGDADPDDSAHVTAMPEVTVRATRIMARAASAMQPTTILTRDAIEASHARDASDAVALAPGAFVRQYGGAGALRTLSIRGTSAQQSVVLVDGVRYQSTAAGGVDLGAIPAAVLRSVEVVRGGDAARFGASALGGAVNLITDPTGSPEAIGARILAGSFGEQTATVSGATTIGAHSANASLTLTRADGDYPFEYREYGEQTTVRRQNADLTSLFARAAWAHPLDGGVRLAASALAFSTSRGVPGAIVQGYREQPRARLDEREVFATIRASMDRTHWQTSIAATTRINRLDYRDPDARAFGPHGIDNRYDRFESSVIASARHVVGSEFVFDANAEIAYARLGGDNLDPSAAGSVDRLQWGAASSASWFIDDALGSSDAIVDAAVRADGFSDAASAFSPSLAMVVRPGDGALRVRVHGALNYRVPTFTEQYYLNFGNTDLRPERSSGIDVGATYELFGSLLVEAGAFAIDTRDQIVAVPRSPLVWTAANISRARSRGVELSATGNALDGLLAINISYTRMRAEDRTPGPTYGNLLAYAPEELMSALIEARPEPLAIGLVWQYASHRHTLPSNAPEAALPRYGTLGAHVSARATLGSMTIDGRIEASNILDAAYQSVRNYPMPGRSVRLGIQVGYAGR